MIEIKFDFSQFEKAAEALGRRIDQLPYALSQTMNEASKKTRDHLIDDTWPSAVKVRNRGFMRATLKREFATKRDLSITIYDSLERGNLSMHADGGTKQGRGNLAIPDSVTVKPFATGKGVPQVLRPRALIGAFKKHDILYQRVGTYEKSGSRKKKGTNNRHLKLMYVLKPSANIKKDVPLREDFRRVFLQNMAATFPQAMAKALAGRRG